MNAGVIALWVYLAVFAACSLAMLACLIRIWCFPRRGGSPPPSTRVLRTPPRPQDRNGAEMGVKEKKIYDKDGDMTILSGDGGTVIAATAAAAVTIEARRSDGGGDGDGGGGCGGLVDAVVVVVNFIILNE